MFLKNRNISFKIKRSKVTDNAALKGRILINIKKSGPIIDPCGVPRVMFSVSDFECLMDTFCVCVDKYDLNQDKALFPQLYISSFFQRTA